MKKQKQKKSQKVNTSKNDEFSSLNSALGSFDLEPPKHYRPTQVDNQKRKSNKKQPKTNQEKRVAQKKRRKRSKMFYKVVSIIAIVVAIAVILVVLSLTVFFKIDTIKVNGNEIYSVEQITAVLPIDKEKNLFLADTEGAEAKLEANLPYIFKAEIKRKLPSTIEVNITETPKIYCVLDKNETYILIDEAFKVLETGVETMPENSIEITEAPITNAIVGQKIIFDNDQRSSDLTVLVNAVIDIKLDEVTAIKSIDINSNYMVYDNRVTFKLGSTDNLEDKVYACLSAMDKLNESDPNAVGTLTATDGKQIYFTEE